MTGAQALDFLMLRFGNRTAAALRTNTLAEMIYQQTVLEFGGELPWFLIGPEETLPVTAGTRAVAAPPDFLREVEELPLYILDNAGNRHELLKRDFYELESHWSLEATSDLPLDYALIGLEFNLFPVPSRDTFIQCRTYKKQPAPTDDAATVDMWLQYAPDLLIATTGEQIAGKLLKDPELVQFFMADKIAAFARLIIDNTARGEVGRARAMG